MESPSDTARKAIIIGNNIKKARTQLKLTQDDLAAMIDGNRITISRYETGKFFPSVPALERLAKALHTTPAALSSKNGYISDHGENNADPIPAINNTETGAQDHDANYERAAVLATETLVRYHVSAAPVSPLPILKALPNVLVVSFTEMADGLGLDRNNLVTVYGAQNQDAITFVIGEGESRKYCVAYNQSLPFYILQRALARELGHIILGHDENHSDEKNTAEALFFSRYLLCPRPLIKAIQESGINLTVKVFGNITGCYGRFLAGVRKTPGAHISADLNRIVKSQFAQYVSNLTVFQSLMTSDDDSIMADFGSFMDNYLE